MTIYNKDKKHCSGAKRVGSSEVKRLLQNVISNVLTAPAGRTITMEAINGKNKIGNKSGNQYYRCR